LHRLDQQRVISDLLHARTVDAVPTTVSSAASGDIAGRTEPP
jgi:hypothetical protein